MANTVDPTLLQYPDVVCYDDVDELGLECTSELQVLEQDVYHVLKQELGSNPDDPDRGIGIEGKLSGTETDFLLLPSEIDSQLREDDRIDDSQTTIIKLSVAGGGVAYTVNVQIWVDGAVYTLPYAFTNGVFSRAGSILTP
jgi:hypothetical protein